MCTTYTALTCSHPNPSCEINIKSIYELYALNMPDQFPNGKCMSRLPDLRTLITGTFFYSVEIAAPKACQNHKYTTPGEC